MAISTETRIFKRYYTNDGKIHPDLDLAALHQQIHALFTHWIANNCHVHDFIQAVDNVATLMYIAYVMDGHPALPNDGSELVFEPIALVFNSKELVGPPQRLYDDKSDLNYNIDDALQREGLAYFFVRWAQEGWLPRDFTQAVTDCARSIIHSYDICRSMGTLGGGKTAKEFLTAPYLHREGVK